MAETAADSGQMCGLKNTVTVAAAADELVQRLREATQQQWVEEEREGAAECEMQGVPLKIIITKGLTSSAGPHRFAAVRAACCATSTPVSGVSR